jgi:hypothetical protein
MDTEKRTKIIKYLLLSLWYFGGISVSLAITVMFYSTELSNKQYGIFISFIILVLASTLSSILANLKIKNSIIGLLISYISILLILSIVMLVLGHIYSALAETIMWLPVIIIIVSIILIPLLISNYFSLKLFIKLIKK